MKDGSPIRQEREINDIQTRKENLKLYLLAEDMINYIEKFQASPKKKKTSTIIELSKVTSYKINAQKPSELLC